MPLNEKQYKETQDAIVTVEGIVRDLPIREFLDSIDRAESLGPMLDPTLYQVVTEKMHRFRRLAVALMVFQTAILEE
jgi:hypothetical protein